MQQSGIFPVPYEMPGAHSIPCHSHHTLLFLTYDPVFQDHRHPILLKLCLILLILNLSKRLLAAGLQSAVIGIFHLYGNSNPFILNLYQDIAKLNPRLCVGIDMSILAMAQKS